MKNKIIYLVLIIIFILLIISSDFIIKKANNIDKKVVDNSEKNNISIEVNNTNIQEEVLNEEKIVLVDFYATWCGPCKMLSPILEEIAIENSDIKLVKVDVDKNEELCVKYNIQAMPTIIVFKQGKIINSSVGVISKEDIKSLF